MRAVAQRAGSDESSMSLTMSTIPARSCACLRASARVDSLMDLRRVQEQSFGGVDEVVCALRLRLERMHHLL